MPGPLAQGLYSLGAVCLGLGLAAGLYLPSGVAALTSFVRPRDWGKAVAMHEIAPNGGMVLAPWWPSCSWKASPGGESWPCWAPCR